MIDIARLTGLTIEIGGNTKDLNTALKEPKKYANDLQSKLKEVNTALKLDPKNTELLTQKQELLKDAISGTEEKSKLLKQAQQEFKDSGGDLNSKSYVQLEADIAKTESALKSLEEQQRKIESSFQKMSDKAAAFGDKATSIGKSFLPITAGISALGVASVKSFNDVDEAIDTIAKKTGATGDQMKDFKDVFDDVATSIPADMNDVGAAIGEINTRLGFTGDQLTEASEQFLKFANINDTDVNTAVQLVSRAMGDAGIEAKDYSSLLDMLTKASQASGISIDKLTENITKYGAPMRSLGFDTASSIAIFSQWEKAGVNTEIAFSGMKKSISNFMKDGKDAKIEFAKLISGIQDGSVTAQEALDIFGTKAGPDLVDAIQQGRFSYEDFLSVIEASEGTVSATFDETQDGVDKMKTAMNAGKIALAEFGEVISNALAPVLEGLTNLLRGLSTFLNSMPDGIKTLIVIIGALVAAIGPVLMIIGQISKGISSLILFGGKLAPLFTKIGTFATAGFGMLKTAATGAFSIITANPVISIVTAIIAIIVALYTQCEWFRDGVNEILAFLGNIFKSSVEFIISLFTEKIPKLISDVTGWFAKLPGNIMNAISSLPGKLNEIGIQMLKSMVSGIMKMFGVPAEKAQEIGNSIVDIFSAFPGKFFEWGKEMIENIGKGIEAAKDWVVDKARGIADSIASFLHFTRPDVGPLRDYEKWMPDFIGGMAKGIYDNMGVIKKAVSDVSTNMMIKANPLQSTGMQGSTKTSDISITNALMNMIDTLSTKTSNDGNIVVPVYLGNRLLDELIIDSNARAVVKSGGR